MIFLVPITMVPVFSLQAFTMKDNPVFVRDILMKGEGTIAFEDAEYENVKGAVAYMHLDAKFVTGFPGQKVPSVYLTETDSTLFINFDETELKSSTDIKTEVEPMDVNDDEQF